MGQKCLDSLLRCSPALLQSRSCPCGELHLSQPSLSPWNPHGASLGCISECEGEDLTPASCQSLLPPFHPLQPKIRRHHQEDVHPKKRSLLGNRGPTLQQLLLETASDLRTEGKRRKDALGNGPHKQLRVPPFLNRIQGPLFYANAPTPPTAPCRAWDVLIPDYTCFWFWFCF